MDEYREYYRAARANEALDLMAKARDLYNDLIVYRNGLIDDADIDSSNEALAASIALRDALNDIITDRS